MNRPHFRRHPRPVDPNPEYSRLDRLDGLHTRIDAEWPDVLAAEARPRHADGFIDRNGNPVSADEWSSLPHVFAPHSFVGGDLAAMAAPADWPPFSGWGEGYEIEPETRIGRHAWTPAEMRAMGDAIHDVVQAAHPPTPAVDEADVEALAGLMDDVEAAVMSATSLARRLLATGRVSVTK